MHILCTEFNVLKRHVSSLNIFAWGVILCGHVACKSFASLFVLRLVLGISEGSITAGFMIVSSMFYTRREHTARVGYWCKDNHLLHLLPYSLLTGLMTGAGLNTKSLLRSQALTYATGQIMSGFISFGALHVRTTGFEPWQWYGQVQHLTHALTFL